MSYPAMRTLVRKAHLQEPSRVRRISWNEHLQAIASQGGIALYTKNGVVGDSEESRRKRWQIWWQSVGRLRKDSVTSARYVRLPKYSEQLAEFAGVMLGDGGVSKYFVAISLHSETDKLYAKFVSSLIKNLFGVSPKIYKRLGGKVSDLVVHRKNLSIFCQSIGLPLGNKLRGKLDIPDWIKQRCPYAVACVRGLIDTDGSVIRHSYTVKGKRYRYKKIAFYSGSNTLLASIVSILNGLRIAARVDFKAHAVWIDSKEMTKRYFDMVGSHNPKHLKRYHE